MGCCLINGYSTQIYESYLLKGKRFTCLAYFIKNLEKISVINCLSPLCKSNFF